MSVLFANFDDSNNSGYVGSFQVQYSKVVGPRGGR